MAIIFTDIAANYRRYGPQLTSQDLYKCFAILTMVIDHVGYFYYPQDLWWRAAGRLSFVVWGFLAGYARPSRPPYILLGLAGLMVLADVIAKQQVFPLNTLITIFVARLFISHPLVNRDQQPERWVGTMFILMAVLPFSLYAFEYGALGMFLALAGYHCRTFAGTKLTIASLVIALGMYVLTQSTGLDFNNLQVAFIITGVAAAGMALYRFRPKTYDLGRWDGATAPLRLLGRNTHYFYAVHFIIMLFSVRLMKPDMLAVFDNLAMR